MCKLILGIAPKMAMKCIFWTKDRLSESHIFLTLWWCDCPCSCGWRLGCCYCRVVWCWRMCCWMWSWCGGSVTGFCWTCLWSCCQWWCNCGCEHWKHLIVKKLIGFYSFWMIYWIYGRKDTNLQSKKVLIYRCLCFLINFANVLLLWGFAVLSCH